jgi:uncharacterized protein (TIGR00725 family)
MRTTVGVVGSGETSNPEALRMARQLGSAIAAEGWVLVNGGRNSGVMDASAEGAHVKGGLVIGILPDDTSRNASRHLDVAVRTGMGSARNYVNVLSSDVVIALKGDAGTLSEIALALKSGRTVISLGFPLGEAFARYERISKLKYVETVEEAIAAVKTILGRKAGA